MQIKPLFQTHEQIDIKSYLSKCGVEDVEEYLKGGASGIESPDKYENMEDGYRLLMETIKER